MFKTFFALTAIVCLCSNATAQNLSSSVKSLPYDLETVTCDEILAATNKNKATKLMAASLYAHGMYMGNRCIKPDYIKAYELYKELGAPSAMTPIIRQLQARADGGNPAAKSALRKLKKAGYVK